MAQREPSIRQLAKKLSGSVANYQQTTADDSLESALGQDEVQPASNEPLPKAKKPARKPTALAEKSSATKSRSKASRTVVPAPVAPSEHETALLESPTQPSRKRKTSDASVDQSCFKKMSTQNIDQGSESDLSEIGATPEHPGLFGDESLKDQLLVTNDNREVDETAVVEPAPAALTSVVENAADTSIPQAAPSPPILAADKQSETVLPTDLTGTSIPSASSSAPHEKSDTRPNIHLQLSPEQSSTPQVGSGPAASLPTPTSIRPPSTRAKKQPVRFRKPTDVSVEANEEDSVVNEDENEPAGDSPTVQKAVRKSRAKAKPRTKVPVSSEKVTEDDLANDVVAPTATKAPRKRKAKAPVDGTPDGVSTPATIKAPRKRKAKTAEDTPCKKPATSRTKAKATGARKAPASTPSAILPADGDALLALPSPPSSQADLATEYPIDADLLKLSRALTHREPLASKPDPIGKPEVWAPGRQELCETLPYYKSAHAGCYSNGGTIFSFMFDSSGVGREYMDSDVVIARMGGSMEQDKKTGVMYQTKDHPFNDIQPQSLLNNIVHKNPLVIICGDKNEGAITRMPHRYCVLDWFKPTHVWGEKTMGKKKSVTTIRYRFERLDRSKEAWFRPASSSNPESTSHAASEALAPAEALAEFGPPAESGSPAVSAPPSDLTLPIQTCSVCSQSCPQVYLIDWICTNPDCTGFWKLSNGQEAPYGELDYHPAFLQHRTRWEREDPPFSLNPGIPQTDQHFGDSLAYVSTRGVVCPDCGRCNTRYMFTHWRCDTSGCKWKLTPQVQVVMPSNLSHNAWDMSSDGPGLMKSVIKPAVHTQIKYFSNYKVTKYTIEGVVGSVIVAKANKHTVSEPGGADDMFRELQTTNVGLERRILRETANTEQKQPQQQTTVERDQSEEADADEDADEGDNEDQPAAAGARMTAFGMNFGMPYKFIASGNSQSFEAAPAAVRSARARLNWAQRVFVNDEPGYQDFNEELIFAYLEKQKIKYHDDGEEGLGPRIATLSLGAPATMSLRVKAKYFSQVSKSRPAIYTDEKPLPLALLESCGYVEAALKKVGNGKQPCNDTYATRLAAWAELQGLRRKGDMAAFRARAKDIPKELDLHRREAKPLLEFHLTHGDIVIMEGEKVQKYLEHAVEPHGHLRFALTCRTILPHHLPPDQLPPYEVLPDQEGYDGSAIREVRDGDREAVVWES